MKSAVFVAVLICAFAALVVFKESGFVSQHPARNVRVGMSEAAALNVAGEPWSLTRLSPTTTYHYREGEFVWDIWIKNGAVFDVRKRLRDNSILKEIERELW